MPTCVRRADVESTCVVARRTWSGVVLGLCGCHRRITCAAHAVAAVSCNRRRLEGPTLVRAQRSQRAFFYAPTLTPQPAPCGTSLRTRSRAPSASARSSAATAATRCTASAARAAAACPSAGCVWARPSSPRTTTPRRCGVPGGAECEMGCGVGGGCARAVVVRLAPGACSKCNAPPAARTQAWNCNVPPPADSARSEMLRAAFFAERAEAHDEAVRLMQKWVAAADLL